MGITTSGKSRTSFHTSPLIEGNLYGNEQRWSKIHPLIDVLQYILFETYMPYFIFY